MEKSTELFRTLKKNPIPIWEGGDNIYIATQSLALSEMLITAILELGDTEHSNDWDLGISFNLKNGKIIQSLKGYPNIIFGWLNEEEQKDALNFSDESDEGYEISIGITTDNGKFEGKEIYLNINEIDSIQYWD